MSSINAFPLIHSFAQTSPLSQEEIMKNLEREFASVPINEFPCPTMKCSQLSGTLSLGRRKLATYAATEHRMYFSPLTPFSDREEKLADIRTQMVGNSIMRQAVAELQAARDLNCSNESVKACGRPYLGTSRSVVNSKELEWADPRLITDLTELFIGELPPSVEIPPFLQTLFIGVYMSIVGIDDATKDKHDEKLEVLKRYLGSVNSKFFFYIVFGSGVQYWNLCMPHQVLHMEEYSKEYQDQLGDLTVRIVEFLSKWFFVSVIQDPDLANDNILVLMPNMKDESIDLQNYIERMYAIGNNQTTEPLKPVYTLVEGLLEPDSVFGHKLNITKTQELPGGDSELLEVRPAFGDFLFDSPMIIHYVDPMAQQTTYMSNRMVFNHGCTNMTHVWKNASHGSMKTVPPLSI